ncbi:MAG: hypothetical protein QNL62_18905 [Gammaproteobacteria bacterium]|nr:hypothetical protein [Gammaproteobacteria bacterium]
MLDNKTKSTLKTATYSLTPNEPLWKRVPVKDEYGRFFSDFMMLIPKLSQQPAEKKIAKIDAIEQVFRHYGKAIVFADLNLKINVLWVTVRPIPGICLELPAAIKHYVPEALLIAQKAH